MSKDLRNNERYLKRLADQHNPVPPPLVWDEIEQVLDKDKVRRRLFPMLWIFGALLMGAAIFINLSGKKDKGLPTVEQETIISDTQKQSDPNSRDFITADSKAIHESTQKRNADNSETIISDTQKQSDRNLRDSKTVDSEAIHELEQEQNANSSESTPPVSDNQEEKKVDSEKPKSFVSQQGQSNHLNTSTADRSLEANTIKINSAPIISKERAVSPRMFTPSTEPTVEDRHVVQVDALQRLKLMQIPFETELPQPDLSKKLTATLSSESKVNLSLASPWFVELGGGIGRNLSDPVLIDSVQGEIDSTQVGLRLNTESKWYTWSASLQLGYQFDNLWYTTVGFDLNQTKSKFDFWRRDVGSLLAAENQSLQITNRDYFNIGEIRYTFADVGLSIGKRFSIDKWRLSLEGGPVFNVSFTANGKVQVGAFEFSRLEDQDEYFKTQIGIGARLSAMLDYPLSDRMWISVGPTYHQYFSTVSSGVNPLEERNAILQIKARVRYHF